MKWLPLHLRRQVHISSYMFKVIKGKAPITSSINLNIFLVAVGMGLTVICIFQSPRILKTLIIWVPRHGTINHLILEISVMLRHLVTFIKPNYYIQELEIQPMKSIMLMIFCTGPKYNVSTLHVIWLNITVRFIDN